MTLKKLALIAFTATALVATSAAAAYAEYAVAVDTVKIRDEPSKYGDKLGTLYTGEIVNVIDCHKSWCYVVRKGPDGWVKKNALDFDFYGYNYGYGHKGNYGFSIYSSGSGLSFGFGFSNY